VKKRVRSRLRGRDSSGSNTVITNEKGGMASSQRVLRNTLRSMRWETFILRPTARQHDGFYWRHTGCRRVGKSHARLSSGTCCGTLPLTKFLRTALTGSKRRCCGTAMLGNLGLLQDWRICAGAVRWLSWGRVVIDVPTIGCLFLLRCR
jgi:hypothetical protein